MPEILILCYGMDKENIESVREHSASKARGQDVQWEGGGSAPTTRLRIVGKPGEGLVAAAAGPLAAISSSKLKDF
jgi:hypothetical protein